LSLIAASSLKYVSVVRHKWNRLMVIKVENRKNSAEE